MKLTDEELDQSLRLVVGLTWDEIAAEHDMRCGACRRGMLTLHQVDATITSAPVTLIEDWAGYAKFDLNAHRPRKTVTLQLKCDACGMQFGMPLHAKER